eukprot:TRINITY_DN80157_c0_g1_i1.p1 TRINITY_DN80157_c0_g1~~TRINITY_DN80157_c0_g1_i1.p1  ORF type:complete len:465 (-),score=102.24 TRINITY_DN80157_c0_g1_i1:152-1546(-)
MGRPTIRGARDRSRTPKRAGAKAGARSLKRADSDVNKPAISAAQARRAATPPAPRPDKPAGTQIQRAVVALKPSSISGRLPCRDDEQRRILEHLRRGLRDGGSEQVLYISGMPGTGKTASVLALVKELRESGNEKEFVFVHTNAMRLGTPNAIFGEVLRNLPGFEKCSANKASSTLVDFFSKRRSGDPVVILLVDEIDQLVTKNQQVLYTIFEWMSMRARLVVAAISNTMDLPERMLPRVANRFEIVRVDYQPYSRAQISEILKERLKSYSAQNAFTPEALQRCAARVAASSGDVRKALQLCRRAVEIKQRQAGKEAVPGAVEAAVMDCAAKELLYANPAVSAIEKFTTRTRRFLISLLLELRKTESDAVPLKRVAARYDRLTALLSPGEVCSTGSHVDDAEFIAARLEHMNIVPQYGKGVHSPQDLVQGVMLTLGCGLCKQDLGTALLKVEEDAGTRNIIAEE